MNTLEIFDTVSGWIAQFSGTTGMGETVKEEEAHNLSGATISDLVDEALNIWGANRDNTIVKIDSEDDGTERRNELHDQDENELCNQHYQDNS